MPGSRSKSAKKAKPKGGRPRVGGDEREAEGVRLLLAGDLDGAVKASGLSLRTLYRRRDEISAARVGQRLVQVKPADRAAEEAPAPPPSSPAVEPSVAEIEAIDTLAEARAVLVAVRSKMAMADDVRFASLAEKALSAINRVEQIEAKRPRVPPKDEVQEAIRGAMGGAVDFLLRQTREAAAKLRADRLELAAWCATLGPMGAEVQRRVDALFGGPA